jgi:hypothetical protein
VVVNLSTSLSNVGKQAAHPKFVWVFNANCDGTIIYNDPVLLIEKFCSKEVFPKILKKINSNVSTGHKNVL